MLTLGAGTRLQHRNYHALKEQPWWCSLSSAGDCDVQEMVKALRPGGRLLLLEHGRSSWGFVNGILDSHAAQHYGKWGCQWNREIEALVQQAGLEIETLRRWHFGTTYLIVARPAPAPAQPQL